jgi:hypothetical protein
MAADLLMIYVIGFVVLALLWLTYAILTGSRNPGALYEGADLRASTSKFQWFLWTAVALFSYAVVYAKRIWYGHFDYVSYIPPNLLYATGFSLTTMVAAKGITSGYVASGQLSKGPTLAAGTTGPVGGSASPTLNPSGQSHAPRPSTATGAAALFVDDDGIPDLSKIQLIAWTFIAIASYLTQVAYRVNTLATPDLPDIDTALLVLMGLGQGAYLGKKLVTTDVPRLTGIVPAAGAAGQEITLLGMSFGDAQAGSQITIDGVPYEGTAGWADKQIKFKLPSAHPNGQRWADGQRISIGLVVGGRDSVNSVPFAVRVISPPPLR